MWPESNEQPKPLKTGLTTGCCATACCVAAAQYLLGHKKLETVSVTLPKGKIVELKILESRFEDNTHSEVFDKSTSDQIARTSTIKDAGDDPDVTHGATIFVELKLSDNKEIKFSAAKGVGTVTREGLALDVGGPAINPVPRKMMTEHLQAIARRYNYLGGFEVAVGVEDGEQIALKTMNPRLGIVDGLSILGTTGIVRPFSCSAYIASIHQGIDVATTNGYQHIAATTGNQSEAAIKDIYQLPEMALIEMGDFVGAVLKYLKKVPIEKLSICGGFGKLTKLAQGHLDLHSSKSSIDFEFLAELAKSEGGDEQLLQEIIGSNTSMQALKFCQQKQVDLAGAVCRYALAKVVSIVPEKIEVEVWAIDRQGQIVANTLSNKQAGLI